MLFPLVKADYFDYRLQHMLQRLIYIVYGALNNLLIVMREYLIFLEYHGSSPTTVVDCKVNDPFVSCGLCYVV
jgi:hypothetical protein